jgi:hypothetical protein
VLQASATFSTPCPACVHLLHLPHTLPPPLPHACSNAPTLERDSVEELVGT